MAAAEQKIEEFAEDLGKLLGNAKSKAEGWLGQRKSIAKHLGEIQDTAAGLLAELGIGTGAEVPGRRKRGRPRRKAAVARPAPPPTIESAPRRKARTMSADARARISAAQKRRWAKLRRSQAAKASGRQASSK
jgi:hypothetical protein